MSKTQGFTVGPPKLTIDERDMADWLQTLINEHHPDEFLRASWRGKSILLTSVDGRRFLITLKETEPVDPDPETRMAKTIAAWRNRFYDTGPTPEAIAEMLQETEKWLTDDDLQLVEGFGG